MLYCSLFVQVRASADLEMQQVVNEVRRQVEKEKEIAIAETKRKKWVRHTCTCTCVLVLGCPPSKAVHIHVLCLYDLSVYRVQTSQYSLNMYSIILLEYQYVPHLITVLSSSPLTHSVAIV